jgi:uncharacterized membrane protein YdbT with pleckstrin-like domain
MRCPQCGFDAVAGAGFCSRCGTRLLTPRPESKREFALSLIMPSWWSYFGSFVFAALLFVLAAVALSSGHDGRIIAEGLFALGAIIISAAIVARRGTSWSITSERLIERHGLLSKTRREIELADIRSVDVSRTFAQRLVGIGNVVIASAASADFLIRMEAVADPDAIAETVRRARLKRLA